MKLMSHVNSILNEEGRKRAKEFILPLISSVTGHLPTHNQVEKFLNDKISEIDNIISECRRDSVYENKEDLHELLCIKHLLERFNGIMRIVDSQVEVHGQSS